MMFCQIGLKKLLNLLKFEGEKLEEERLDWDDYWLNLLPGIGSRGTCNRGKSGTIIVSPCNTIVTTGYVGAPSGMDHCDDVGHRYEHVVASPDGSETSGYSRLFMNGFTTHCVRTIHAEQNAIFQAAEEGKAVRGCTIYCTMFPCFRCAYAIIRVKIKRVVALYDYHKAQQSKLDFDKANIKWEFKNEALKY